MQQNEKIVDEAERSSDGVFVRGAADGDGQAERSAPDGALDTRPAAIESLVRWHASAPSRHDRPRDVVRQAWYRSDDWKKPREGQLLAYRIVNRGEGSARQPQERVLNAAGPTLDSAKPPEDATIRVLAQRLRHSVVHVWPSVVPERARWRACNQW